MTTMKVRRNGFAASTDKPAAALCETREKLLDAAQQVFVEFGYYSATVRQICKRAGVNLALVNYHFGDKLQLYTEVIRRAMYLSKLSMLEGINDPSVDPRARLRDLVIGFLRHLKKKETACEILMQQERVRPTPAMELITEKSMRPAYEAMCGVIGRILDLPAAHETTRLVAHTVIAQIKYFGESEHLLVRLDPTILIGRTDEELANYIISFSLGRANPQGASNEFGRLRQGNSELKTKATRRKMPRSTLASRIRS